MRLLLTGLSHHTAPVELRERLASCDLDPTRLLTNLRELPAVREAFFLSTCNRFEFLLGLDPAEAEANLADLDQGLARLSQVSPAEMGDCFYRHIEQDAVRHLFRVASSLDSMVVGEPQILGQLKAAYVQASRAGVLGPILNRLMHRGFFVAKRVRTETGVADSAVSIAFAAVELARKIFGLLEGRHALLIGAGEMAELAAEHLLANGASSLTVANRTLANAVKAAQKFDGQAVSLEELDQALLQADIVISSTGATEPVITAKMVKAAMKPRRHRPLFLIDIAVPRDIEEKVGRLENVYLYDIDDLDQVVARNRAKRENEAVRAERIVAEEAIKFQGWLDSWPWSRPSKAWPTNWKASAKRRWTRPSATASLTKTRSIGWKR